ncbi:MAG: hypothetical protein ACJASX_003012 [Limisphaerales bacterium]|jgi:hypothetical protein
MAVVLGAIVISLIVRDMVTAPKERRKDQDD